MNSEMPSDAYSSIRSATWVWLPTSAVPAPPRTSPTPAHRLDTRYERLAVTHSTTIG
jgi:hypothetical protein